MLTDKKTGSFQMAIQGIFYSWEKMRILYNLVLLIESMYLIQQIRGFWDEISTNQFLINAVFCVLSVNVCFMLGPLLESYFTWMGVRLRALRYLVFLGGLIFSIIAVYALFSKIDWNINGHDMSL